MEIKEVELAYTAGLFDGEGSLSIFKCSRGNSYGLSIAIQITDKEVLDYISSLFGGKVTSIKRRENNKRDTWTWSLHSLKAKSFLVKIYPFLRLKKESAAICIEFVSRYHQPGSHVVSLNRQALGEEFLNKLKVYHLKVGSTGRPRKKFNLNAQPLL